MQLGISKSCQNYKFHLKPKITKMYFPLLDNVQIEQPRLYNNTNEQVFYSF